MSIFRQKLGRIIWRKKLDFRFSSSLEVFNIYFLGLLLTDRAINVTDWIDLRVIAENHKRLEKQDIHKQKRVSNVQIYSIAGTRQQPIDHRIFIGRIVWKTTFFYHVGFLISSDEAAKKKAVPIWRGGRKSTLLEEREGGKNRRKSDKA